MGSQVFGFVTSLNSFWGVRVVTGLKKKKRHTCNQVNITFTSGSVFGYSAPCYHQHSSGE